MHPPKSNLIKPCLVLLTDAWGAKYGGINSFNMDFAKGLGLLLSETHQVICVVLEATEDEREDARRKHVRLLSVGRSEHHGHFEAFRAAEVVTAVRGAIPGAPILWWIGHDTITGDLALALPNAAGEGQCALINHMSYQDYVSYKHGVGAKARDKAAKQRSMFKRADKVFAVGPLLRQRLADMLGRESEKVPMLVPGLADIEIAPQPKQFIGITFGRLDPENDRIKQGWLAAAAFASAYAEALKSPAVLPAYRSPPLLNLIGLAAAGGAEEDALHQFVEGRAGRVLNLIPVPYDDNRDRVFEQLRRCSLAMMLSWHEGFGLTGWEAIAAGVPLIVSENSGVRLLIDEILGGSGMGCMSSTFAVSWEKRQERTSGPKMKPRYARRSSRSPAIQ
jgi:glycosyltransferase involved in cell wall biosynthesis